MLLPTKWTKLFFKCQYQRHSLGNRVVERLFLFGKAGFGGTGSSLDGNNTNDDAPVDVLDFDFNRMGSFGDSKSLKLICELLFFRSSLRIVLEEENSFRSCSIVFFLL